MLHRRSATLVCLALVAIIDSCTANPPSCKNGTESDGGQTISEGLCGDFQALRDLIPRETLNQIIVEHYKCDKHFRKAINFMHTNGFSQIEQEIDATSTYQGLLSDLKNDGVKTTDITTVEDIFNCILIPMPSNLSIAQDINCARVSKKTFIQDILAAMPRDKVYDFIESSLLNVSNFGEFYIAVQSPEFQKDLHNALHARDMAKPIRQLKHKCIDLPALVRAMMTILSWGPRDF